MFTWVMFSDLYCVRIKIEARRIYHFINSLKHLKAVKLSLISIILFMKKITTFSKPESAEE